MTKVQFITTDRLYYTLFADEFARKAFRGWVSSLEDLADVIRSPTAASKGGLPLLKLAGYGDLPTDKDCLRHDANVEWISGCELDIDNANGSTLTGAAQKLNGQALT